MKAIKDFIHGADVQGDLGIEVEMEGLQLPKEGSKYWKVEMDGSLGGPDNAEYVLRKPIKVGNLYDALKGLKSSFKEHGSKLKPSVRAGVHVHINVQDMSVLDVANFVTLYLVLEDLLLEVCGEGRQSNLFCLKGCEAEYMIYQAAQFFKTEDIGYLDHNNIRYSGINLAAIPKYGSVEFRSFRTPKDINEIGDWAETLHELKELSKEYECPSDILSGYSDFNPVEFLTKHLPRYADKLMDLDDWQSKLKRGMRSAQDLAFSQRWGKKVKVDDVEIPDAIQRMIADHPNIDPQAIIEMYRNRRIQVG